MKNPLKVLRWWWCWRRQGRPINEPVVLEQGHVIICPHGRIWVTGWRWSIWHQKVPIDGEELVDRYSARYPQERVPVPQYCRACRSAPPPATSGLTTMTLDEVMGLTPEQAAQRRAALRVGLDRISAAERAVYVAPPATTEQTSGRVERRWVYGCEVEFNPHACPPPGQTVHSSRSASTGDDEIVEAEFDARMEAAEPAKIVEGPPHRIKLLFGKDGPHTIECRCGWSATIDEIVAQGKAGESGAVFATTYGAPAGLAWAALIHMDAQQIPPTVELTPDASWVTFDGGRERP